MVAVGLTVVAAAKDPWATAAALASAYLLSIPFSIARVHRIRLATVATDHSMARASAAPLIEQ